MRTPREYRQRRGPRTEPWSLHRLAVAKNRRNHQGTKNEWALRWAESWEEGVPQRPSGKGSQKEPGNCCAKRNRCSEERPWHHAGLGSMVATDDLDGSCFCALLGMRPDEAGCKREWAKCNVGSWTGSDRGSTLVGKLVRPWLSPVLSGEHWCTSVSFLVLTNMAC